MDIAYSSDTARQVTDGNGHTLEHRFESHGMFTGYKTPLSQEYTTTYSPALFDNSGGARTIINTDPQARTVATEFTYEPTFHLLSSRIVNNQFRDNSCAALRQYQAFSVKLQGGIYKHKSIHL